MLNRLSHTLRGTKHMQGAWPEGTLVNAYGDRDTAGEPVRQEITGYTPYMSPIINGVPSYGQGMGKGFGFRDNPDYHAIVRATNISAAAFGIAAAVVAIVSAATS